jgi:hypothetical protein
VPEGAAVVLERVQAIPSRRQAVSHIGEGELGPVGQVTFGGRPVAVEVAPDDLSQRLLPLQAPWIGARSSTSA